MKDASMRCLESVPSAAAAEAPRMVCCRPGSPNSYDRCVGFYVTCFCYCSVFIVDARCHQWLTLWPHNQTIRVQSPAASTSPRFTQPSIPPGSVKWGATLLLRVRGRPQIRDVKLTTMLRDINCMALTFLTFWWSLRHFARLTREKPSNLFRRLAIIFIQSNAILCTVFRVSHINFRLQ